MKDKIAKQVLVWMLVFISLLLLVRSFGTLHLEQEIDYSAFKRNLREGKILEVSVRMDLIRGKIRGADGKEVSFKTIPLPDPKLVEDLETYKVQKYNGETDRTWWPMIVQNLVYVLIFWFVFWVLLIRPMQGGGKQALSFGRSKAKLQSAKKVKVTFSDVAGCDEVKEELKEIIEFLKEPAKFQKLGGKIPKGVLLYGAPGTGKTLLAKAVAGEANVPFFSSSGSEFVEMFVGVGASRVRDLFEQGRKNAPCLLFVDEIDAVGRHRFAGFGGGHDEREQTLNQLLVEMDGFDTKEGVIMIAATNRPDVLDPALLRPGRFDRQVIITIPDLRGRKEILEVHAKSVKIGETVDLAIIARRTPGFVGADLANLVNEAALLAARKNKNFVEMKDLEEAIERVIAGPERKSRMISEKEKKVVAYHESGHALVARLIPGTDPLHKISIIPRGPALGYTLQLPTEDRYLISKEELLNRITVLLGGRTAEELVFNEITSGAQDDFAKATAMVQKMVTEFGMSESLGPIAFRKKESEIFLGRDIMAQQKEYSEKTAELIDSEVKRIITESANKAKILLKTNFDKLKILADKLMEKEILDIDEINLALGFPPEIKETAKTVPPPASGLTEKETSSSIGLPPTTQILPQPAT
ncbi:MAG: cell division protein FtsH [Elusimicrobia bacterium RIFCSPLOWO2_02_FULL_39_32]|nr:MAG: cell division protein FtsH [Elusimicrobia bacterium RIFCSPHIGHO2_02_FULL_39_36]OGR91754.1 MAG: cell division protein FtsH [Elusimicrobia bacterium RIFCSPLOWO2_02_FULL_39_32]OGR98413.1 MAG: cell division protein FtsH [Elusimicrobia bacterium RIFCSPLOWO2_12_FULL_39_28]